MQSLALQKIRTLTKLYSYNTVSTNCGGAATSCSSERDLKDKIAVVTGGAEGLGLIMADYYLREGVKAVALLDINEELGCLAAQDLNGKYGDGKVSFLKCDVVTDLEEVSNCIFSMFPYVDVLVNNAGILDEFVPKKLIDINLAALIEWALKYYEVMRKDKCGKGGTIVNLSSIYGFRVNQYLPVYQASKFGIMGFTKALGHPYNYKRTGVRVYAICPGFTWSTMTRNVKATNDVEVKKDIDTFLKAQKWQEADAVGRCAVETFKKADSGTAWLIEGNEPITMV